MEIDTSKLTDEQISKLNEFIHTMEKSNKATKWWIMPKYSVFVNVADYNKYGPCYQVEPEEPTYSRSKPPLKTGFNSKEEAEKWLDDYLKEEDLFKESIREITKLINNLGSFVQKLKNHQYINNTDMLNCFNSFYASCRNGSIKEVIKE